MYRVLCFLLSVALPGALAQADCVPESVGQITIDVRYVLHWQESTNCEVTYYLVYIAKNVDDLQYIYAVNNLQLDVSFLPDGAIYDITVSAYSKTSGKTGEESRRRILIPSPPGIYPTLHTLDTIRKEQGILLNWDGLKESSQNAQAFRVVIRDDNHLPLETHTKEPYLYLNTITPCTTYEFSITPIYDQHSEGPTALMRYFAPAAKAGPPKLQGIVTTSNSANMTFNLDSYSSNNCPITAIVINGPFARKYGLTDSSAKPSVSILVSPLQPNTKYLLDVQVENSAGISEPLQVLFVTAPATE